MGVAGTLWGDPLVHAAAQLAGLLEDVSQKLGLVKIIPAHEATPTGHRIIYRLQTNSETEIIWGRFEPNDPQNIGKKKRLLEIAELYHSLDNVVVSPGSAFGEAGEGFMRLALVEKEDRLRQAVRQINRALR